VGKILPGSNIKKPMMTPQETARDHSDPNHDYKEENVLPEINLK